MARSARAWLRSYDRAWLRADVMAGITLAAYLLPAALGDASLAGLPPQAGLYACVFSGLVFWLFCSSRVTTITVTSAISMLVGATLAGLSGGDPVRQATLAACTALMVAIMGFIAYALRAGTIVNFFSETVLVGFKCGLAFYLASTQLPKLFGYGASHGDFWQNMSHFVRTLDQTNPTSVLLGGVALCILLVGKMLFKHRPVALFVLVGSIVAAGLLHLDARGVKLLGDVPHGLPMPTLPLVGRADLDALFPLALACFLLAAVETSAIGRMFSDKHGYRFDATQEFLAIGGANLVAGLGAGLPVSGGSSQSLVNESAGARTPLSGLIAALITMMVTLFLAGLLRDLPQPALAAIVLAAITGLVDAHALKEIWRFSREEFAVAMAAFIGVLGAGLLNGVLIGVALSILLLIRRAAHPRIVEIGRVPGTTFFASLARHPENERIADVLVVRPEGSILYFNVDHVRDRVAALIAGMTSTPRLVILMMSNVPFVDLAGAGLLIDAQRTLATHGITLRLAEARTVVWEALRRKDTTATGFVQPNQSVDEILRDEGRAGKAGTATVRPSSAARRS